MYSSEINRQAKWRAGC